MQKSEKIGALAAALSKLQGEIQDAQKDKQGYSYKYADLAQVLGIARPLLAKYGLAIAQLPGNADDKVTVETVLSHESGEWISETISLPVHIGKGMSHAQAVGSIITYARRYAMAAILGITQADNDAAADSGDDGDHHKKHKSSAYRGLDPEKLAESLRNAQSEAEALALYADNKVAIAISSRKSEIMQWFRDKKAELDALESSRKALFDELKKDIDGVIFEEQLDIILGKMNTGYLDKKQASFINQLVEQKRSNLITHPVQ